MRAMTIGRVAEAAGVGVETIRFYERRGLIAQPKRPAGAAFRAYPDDVVAKVHFIRRAQETGFTLAEIADLLSLRTDPDGDCADVRSRALVKLADVERKLAELARIRSALEAMIATCPVQGARRMAHHSGRTRGPTLGRRAECHRGAGRTRKYGHGNGKPED